MSGSDSDEYGAYNDFSGLTEEDFARLDALSCVVEPDPGLPSKLNVVLSSEAQAGLPAITIEVEGSNTVDVPKTVWSPLQRYRRSGTLSVTDLISPSWCVLDTSYLRGAASD
jgi:hypothetical protein